MPWSLVLLLSTAQFIANADRGVVAIFATDLRQAFDLSDTQIGSLQGAPFIVGYLVTLLWSGTRRAVWPINRYLSLCVLIWTIGAVAFALSSSYGELLGARLLLATGQAAFLPVAVLFLDGGAAHGDRARALSSFSASSAMGRSGGLLIGGLLLTGMTAVAAFHSVGSPWRWAALAMLVPNLVIAGLLLRLPPVSKAPERTDGLIAVSLRLVRENGRALLWIVAASGVIVIVQSCGAWAPSMLHRRFGLDTGASSVAIGILTLLAAPAGHLLAGRWIARRTWDLGAEPLLPIAASLAAASAVMVAISGSLALVLVGFGMLIASSGFAAAVALIHFQRLVDRRDQRSANSLYFFAVTLIGTAAGPFLTGVVSDRLAADGSGLALALACVTGAAALIVVASFVVLRRTHGAIEDMAPQPGSAE